jgi:hypothetical protein
VSDDKTMRVNVSVRRAVYQAARTKSKQTGIPVSFVINCALEDWVKGRFKPARGCEGRGDRCISVPNS